MALPLQMPRSSAPWKQATAAPFADMFISRIRCLRIIVAQFVVHQWKNLSKFNLLTLLRQKKQAPLLLRAHKAVLYREKVRPS